ncbi:MAG: hypothetical protein ACREM8_14410 [Vulcanimicrobiaceae bacterium]
MLGQIHTGGAAPPHGPALWGRPGTLADHVARHGGDFGTHDPVRYARLAHDFIERAEHPGNGLEIKVGEGDGAIRVFNPRSDAFGAYNADDSTRTFFKPGGGQRYFDRQPGRIVPVAPA